MSSFFDFVCLLGRLFWYQPQSYGLLIFEMRTISRFYYQPGPMDPYAFYNVSVMSMREILQLMSSLDRNCCSDLFIVARIETVARIDTVALT